MNRRIVLVTGGTGYLAGFCIARLLDDQWLVRTTVRCLDLESTIRRSVAKLTDGGDRLTVIAANLNDDTGWSDAMAGCDFVLHLASPFPADLPKSDDELIRPARDGALRILTKARDAGVKRVVMTSSIAAVSYGNGATTQPRTEFDWSDELNHRDNSAYERSKTIAERAAWKWHAREGKALELVTICPGLVLGPVLSPDYSTSIEIIRKMLDGSALGLPRLGWPIVDVRDVTDLHIRAMTTPRANKQRYIGAGPFLWMRDIAQILRRSLPEFSREVPHLIVPDWLARVSAAFQPTLRGRLFELGKKRLVSSEKALHQLGWKARPVEETIVDTASSLVQEGVIKIPL